MTLLHFALTSLNGFEAFEQDLLVVMRDVLRKGFDYLVHLHQPGRDGDDFLSPLKELVLEEIRLSLLLGVSSVTSVSGYYTLFGPQPDIDFPSVPSDLQFVFSGPPEGPEVRQAAFGFQERWYTLSRALYRHFEFVLAYTPSSKLQSAVHYCWSRLATLLTCFDDAIRQKITTDPHDQILLKTVALLRAHSALGELLTPAPVGVRYFGLFLIASGAYGGLPTVVTWLTNNLSGSTKRGVGSAFQIVIGNLGAFVSSNVYRSKDSPHYRLGHGVVIGFVAMAFVAAPLYAFLLKRQNDKKERLQAEQDALPDNEKRVYSVQELRDMGDRAPEFVYTIYKTIPLRSNSTLEVVRPARRRTRTPSIGPSSPESRWSTLHMSYSLTYHLVDMAGGLRSWDQFRSSSASATPA
ncbi:hypothetical protein JCM16303_000241 [Sporobolomyces ruberrimus]